jgi:uridine monophosphate synthetase
MNTQKSFVDKLLSAIEENQSLLYVALDPDPETFPDVIISSPEDWHTWLYSIIKETSKLVCAYKLNLGFYQALGISGLELLQKTLPKIPPHIPIILDAKHSDLNTSTVFAKLVFEEWNVDAVTLSPYAGLDQVAPFLVYLDKAVFILCATANPSASILQEYPSQEKPLYLQFVEACQTWGTPEKVGLEVGFMADMLARIRQIAPERLILIEGDMPEENDLINEEELTQILAAGLDKNGANLLLPVPPNLLFSQTPAQDIQALRDKINEERLHILEGCPTCELWLPDVCFLKSEPHQDLILQLFDIGCITFGDHVQASGEIFPYYIDLRRIISMPQIFHQVVSAYADILKDLKFDRVAGIPYGSLPTATGLSLRMQHPMVFPRKEVKAYGAGRLIEGHFVPGETIVVVDDILITGKSAIEGAEKLKSVGLNVKDIVVFIDHERGVKERLLEHGYRGHAVLTVSEIAQVLYQGDRINSEQLHLFNHSY